MKIYVFNLIGKRMTAAILAVTLFFIVLVTGIIGVISLRYGEDMIFADAAAIPYDKIILVNILKSCYTDFI